MRSVLLPRALSFGRGDRSGSTLVSAVVAAGVSTVGLLATLSLITTSMKAGRRAQGLADAGALGDSLRTVFRANSGAGCTSTFVPVVGTNLPAPPVGVVAATPPSMTLTSIQIPASNFNPNPTPILSVGELRGALRVTGLTLTRTAPNMMRLQVSAEKAGQSLGSAVVTIPALDLLATFDSGTNALTECSYAGAGVGAAAALSAQSVCEALGGTYTAASGGTAANCAGAITGTPTLWNCTCGNGLKNVIMPRDLTGQHCIPPYGSGATPPSSYSWSCSPAP